MIIPNNRYTLEKDCERTGHCIRDSFSIEYLENSFFFIFLLSLLTIIVLIFTVVP